jgi:hypothetical protein
VRARHVRPRHERERPPVRRVHFVRGERALDEPVPLVRPRDPLSRRLRARHALGRARRKVRRYEPARRARNLTYAVRLQLWDYARNLRRRHPLILLEHFFRFFLFLFLFLVSYHAHFFFVRALVAPWSRGAPGLFLDFFFTFVPFLFFSFYSFHQNRISLVHVLLTKMRGTGTGTTFFLFFSFFLFLFSFLLFFFSFFSFLFCFLFLFSFFQNEQYIPKTQNARTKQPKQKNKRTNTTQKEERRRREPNKKEKRRNAPKETE